ncbi:hypothetical protein WICPIJ_009830 [Wickerhamomyces pijperi]|uniref:Uncharacterized protein n=1 Tax=Wickerhamomyces pijperi TaxID=599730 RepID=A0A9P8PJW6_WICPI|nr:hypothetical protein WICPIJ_009830 [Wickerhamomyces pijperi]
MTNTRDLTQSVLQVMSHSAGLITFTAAEKLQGYTNFQNWAHLVKTQLGFVDLVLSQYLDDGVAVVYASLGLTMPAVDEVTGAYVTPPDPVVAAYIGALDRFVHQIIQKSVNDLVLQDIRYSNCFGRDLFLFLQTKYGSMNFGQMVTAVSEVLKPLQLDLVEGANLASSLKENVFNKLNADQMAGLVLFVTSTTGELRDSALVHLSMMSPTAISFNSVKDLLAQLSAAAKSRSESANVGLVAGGSPVSSRSGGRSSGKPKKGSSSSVKCWYCDSPDHKMPNCQEFHKLKATKGSHQNKS